MESTLERISQLEAKINLLNQEYKEMKQIIHELTQGNTCEYCEYIRSLYTCMHCSRKICRKCCIKNHTKSYTGEPICEIICNYCKD